MPKFATFTQVTYENFIAWKKKFDAEMYEVKKRQKGFVEEELNLKPSGRQFFLKEKQKAVEEELVDDEDAEEVEDYEEEDEQEYDNEGDEQRVF